MTPDKALEILTAADLARRTLLESVAVEAYPLMLAAWEACPGKLTIFGGLMRVERVTHTSFVTLNGHRIEWDEIWLARAAYKPFNDSDLVLAYVGNNAPANSAQIQLGLGCYALLLAENRIASLSPHYGFSVMPEMASKGVIWLQEPGRLGKNNDTPVIRPCIFTVNEGPDGDQFNTPPLAELVRSEEWLAKNDENSVERVVYTAAVRWLEARGRGEI